MSDSYTQFSFEIEDITQEESAWLANLLALDFEDEAERKEIESALGIPKDIQACIEFWPDFSHSLSDKALWLYDRESGSPYNAALLVRAYLAKFPPKGIKLFSVAYTCSKARLDEFAGETYVVTSRHIYSDAFLAGMLTNVLEDDKQRKLSVGDLDIIVRPKKRGRKAR
jgi:hypothetical protein